MKLKILFFVFAFAQTCSSVAQKRSQIIKLDFFNKYCCVGDAHGNYSKSKALLKKGQYLFMTGCSDPSAGIYDAVIKVNGKFIKLKPKINAGKNENNWPLYFEGDGYTLRFKMIKNSLENDSLQINYKGNSINLVIYGEYRDEWGD